MILQVHVNIRFWRFKLDYGSAGTLQACDSAGTYKRMVLQANAGVCFSKYTLANGSVGIAWSMVLRHKVAHFSPSISWHIRRIN
jgi:hypothetical protein